MPITVTSNDQGNAGDLFTVVGTCFYDCIVKVGVFFFFFSDG